MDKIKIFVNTFRERWRGSKKFKFIILASIVGVILVFSLFNSAAQKKGVRTKIDTGTTVVNKNPDAGFTLPNNPEYREGLQKKEEDRKNESSGGYIQQTHKVDMPPSAVKRVSVDTNTSSIEDVMKAKPVEKPVVTAKPPSATISRTPPNPSQSQRRGNEKSPAEAEIQRLNNLYALADAYSQPNGAFVSNKSLDTTEIEALDNKKTSEGTTTVEEDFKIIPGSTFLGQLLTPINSNYPEMKVLIRFSSGDLMGYVGVGKADLKSLGSGMVMTVDKIVSPQGKEYQVEGLAFNKTDGNPGFRDDVNMYLAQRLGYGFLGDAFGSVGTLIKNRMDDAQKPNVYGLNKNNTGGGNDGGCAKWVNINGTAYCEQLSNSSVNERVQINDENKYKHSVMTDAGYALAGALADRTGSTMGGIFSKIADSYETEVVVNPQAVLVIFY